MLRERGQNEDAERLRAGELMALVVALRTPEDNDTVMNEKLNALFAVEAERVANAAVLAELLVPMLSDQFRSQGTFVASSPPGPAPMASASRPSPPSAPKQPLSRGGSIADFIDDMIAQETPPDRPGHGSHRRAS